MVKYFLDTEFIEDGKTIDLISIGIVCSDGREYYAINYDCDFSKANDWVREHVLKSIPDKPLPQQYGTVGKFYESEEYKQGWRNKRLIAEEIKTFLNWDNGFTFENKPEIWTYYGSYDWVVFCQLWGRMLDLPFGFPMFTMDIKQLANSLGNPKLPKQGEGEHHALNDARWNRTAWQFLNNIQGFK